MHAISGWEDGTGSQEAAWCREDLNVAIAFKAMAVESDQELVQLIGPEPAFIPLLFPTLQESKQLGIYTQQQALDYIGTSHSQRLIYQDDIAQPDVHSETLA